MKHSLLVCLLLIATFLFSACAATATNSAPKEEVLVMAADVGAGAAPVVADPEGALNAIYESLDSYIAKELSYTGLKEVIGVMELRVDKVYARYSDARGGLADVVIIKPKKNYEVELREALYRYVDRRVSEFEAYDILNSHEIAQNAVIFEQGEYIIMLMLADNDAAQTIIDQYLPI